MGYNTKSKKSLLELLENNKELHLTIEDIKELYKDKNEEISLATIYRRVNELVDHGLVQKIVYDNSKKACYQIKIGSDCHNHYHMICEKCGKLIHLDCDEINELVNHISNEHNFRINKYKVVFYGLCEECSNDNRRSV